MKHHIAIKFLAILLCAASLLGAVGCGLGIVFLTEEDLYDQSPAQLRAEDTASTAEVFALNTLTQYATETLGGYPKEALTDYVGNFFPSGSYGYRIVDEAGNVLTAVNEELLQGSAYRVYTAEGSYRNVREIGPYQEPILVPEEPCFIAEVLAAEGESRVYEMRVDFGNGTTQGYSHSQGIGLLSLENGTMTFQGERRYEDFSTGEVSAITFLDAQGDTLFTATSGTIAKTGDGCLYYSCQMEETVFQNGREVYGIVVGNDDESEGVRGGVLGYLLEEQDQVTFVPRRDTVAVDESWMDRTITSIRFEDENGDAIYEAYSTSGVGTFYYYNDAGALAFRATSGQTVVPEEEGTSGTIRDSVNAYQEPSLSAAVIGALGAGYPVEILTRATVDGVEWGYVQGMGWILMDQIQISDGTVENRQVESTEPESTLAFAHEQTDFYESPSLTAAVRSHCPAGTSFEILLTETLEGMQWAQTEHGWIRMDSVTLRPAEPAAALEEDSQPVAQAETETPEAPEQTEPADTQPEETVPAEPRTAGEGETSGLGDTIYYDQYYDTATGQSMGISYSYVLMPAYTLELWLLPGATAEVYDTLVDWVWSQRISLFWYLAGFALVLAITTVYLCCAAGKKPGREEIRAGGLNCLPLDLYFGLDCGGVTLLVLAIAWGAERLWRRNLAIACGYVVGLSYGVSLLVVCFCFACAAQFRTAGGYWWRNSVVVRCCGLVGKLLGRCWKLLVQSLPLLGNFLRWIGRVLLGCLHLMKRLWDWFWGRGKALLKKLGRSLDHGVRMLPLTWQWLLAGTAIVLLVIVGLNTGDFTAVVCLALSAMIVLYGARCFGTLAEGTKRMSKGDLDIQIEDPWMIGAFQEFAQDLNALADVAVVAAQKQLKSERMKTELITNVSHDIKTPLTSIINFVDLLRKPHTQEEGERYLEVLDRQSQRLKKLIEDLMEMSKANTGNMSVEIAPLDAVETVNQALGEFADKLAAAQLTPVFRRPEKDSVTMLADGRLAWRVLSNLLSNAVKYALPGTRLYIDLMELEGKVVLSLKNISREELNVDAEDLMERFVRGDSSRNTEGSGLGLNIAKSLMELQKGQLQLLVDGDLFKVTLIFPGK